MTIDEAHAYAAPNWEAWEYYPLYVAGTRSGVYSAKLVWGYFDGVDEIWLSQHTFQPTAPSWTHSYIQATRYEEEERTDT
jgi:hypothetical protein